MMATGTTPYPMHWPVRPVDENPNLRVEEYRPPVVPAVAPPRVITEEMIAAMVRDDEAREEYQRRRLHAHSITTAVLRVQTDALTPPPRPKVPLWTRLAKWLST